ncbi:MAG: hypothetical protein ACLFVD_07425 [Dehalococcoidia bacterium]
MRVGCFLFHHFSFYVEARYNATLRGRPVIIGGLPHERKAVYDVSQEALACGVRVGMLLREAYALCPQGLFLPLEEESYNNAFTAVLTLLADHSPVVEAGCRGLCPQTSRGTPDFGTNPAERFAFIDLSYESRERQFAAEIGQVMEQCFHLHSSIAVASNRFVAWAAASHVAGPGETIVIPEGGEGDFVKDLPVRLLPVSSRTLERLELLGIRRMGQLAGLSSAAVSLEFGNEGERLWRLCNGIDGSRLVPWSAVPMLKEHIYFEAGAEAVSKVLASGDELLTRLNQQLQERWQCCLRLIISLRLSNDHIVERVVHFKEATSSRETMLRHLKQCLVGARFAAPVREMRLAVTDLCPESGRQAPISSGFVDEPLRRREQLTSALSWLQHRYGKWVVGRMLAKQSSALPEDSFSFTGFDL